MFRFVLFGLAHPWVRFIPAADKLFQCFVCSRLNGCSRSFVGSAVVNVVVVAVVDVVVATVDVVTIAVVVVVAVAAVNTLK